jgi:hypothetical protein
MGGRGGRGGGKREGQGETPASSNWVSRESALKEIERETER